MNTKNKSTRTDVAAGAAGKEKEKDKAPAEENKTQLATVATSALATAGIDLAEDAAESQNNFGKDDMQMPILRMLQSGSPQVKKSEKEAYIPGAQEGMLLAVTTKELFNLEEQPLRVIPVFYRRTVVEWRIREEGGGYVKDHGEAGFALLQKCKKDDKGRFIAPGTEGKNQLVETQQYVVLYEDKQGDWPTGILSFTSTQLKKGRAWNTKIDTLRVPHPKKENERINPPMFYQYYLMGVVAESNDAGSWMGYTIETGGPVTELDNGVSVYMGARDLARAIKEGAFNMEAAAAGSGEGGGVQSASAGNTGTGETLEGKQSGEGSNDYAAQVGSAF